MMNATEMLQHLQSLFPAVEFTSDLAAIDPWIQVPAETWTDVAKALKTDEKLAFDSLRCISGVDFCKAETKKGQKLPFEEHLELVYHLYSHSLRHRLVIKIHLPRWQNDQPNELPEVASVASLWPTADWHEREVYDLMGVKFLDHPDLRRILCPEDWQGHPLRKDYQMPLEYHGIRAK